MALLMKAETETSADSSVSALIHKSEQEDSSPREEMTASFLEQLSIWFFDYFRLVGIFFRRFCNAVKRRWNSFYEKHLQRHAHKLDMFWLRMKKRFSRFYKGILFQFFMFLKFFLDAWHVVRGGFCSHRNRSIPVRCCYAVGAFCRGVRNNVSIFVTFLNYAMPVLAIGLFINLIGYVCDLNFAVSVEYNGEHIGFVQNEKVYEQAEAQLQERLLYQENDEILEKIPKFEVMVVDPTSVTTEPAKLTDTIIRSSSADMVQATGIKVDGTFYGAVKDAAGLRNLLDELKNKYRTGAEGERVEFVRDIKLDTGLYLQKNVKEEEDLLSLLNSQTEQDVYYTVVEGDAPITIAKKNDMTLDSLVALNPDIMKNCMIGKQVLVNKSQPFLPVKCIRSETYSVEIPFETEYVDSSKLYKGTQQIITDGAKGKKSVTAEVSYVDGVEIGRTVLSSTVVKEPVTKQIAKGTKSMPVASGYVGSRSNLGFVNPVVQGRPYLSQGFGRTRYSRYHTGLDIAFRGNGYGTPIIAVYPGTVEYAGWRGSYGNLVIINHGGGIKSYYAHCSKLAVSVGSTVAQGQQVGNVGSTGRSTGNHCHFMITVNGAYQNPLYYVPGY